MEAFLLKESEAFSQQAVLRLVLQFLTFALLVSCSQVSSVVEEEREPPSPSFLSTSDGKVLSLEHWNLQARPHRVIIALHGIGGAASDFRNLGKALPTESPRTTLYALNLRANGWDPEPSARGDIADPQLWIRDLQELHRSLRKRHPGAEFLWLGESMGSLIVLHAAAESEDLPAGIVLSSPVISVEAIPRSQRTLLRVAARLAPRYRFSLAALAGGELQATTNSEHFEQSKKNAYDIERYTLRFLATLADLAEGMPALACETTVPTLVLHGSKDFLSSQNEIETFSTLFPNKPEHREFVKSHHLLFFDAEKADVAEALLRWGENLPKPRSKYGL